MESYGDVIPRVCRTDTSGTASMSHALRLLIIMGSTRPTRLADQVAPWVVRRAQAREAFSVGVIDLGEWPLAIFGEHLGTIGDFADPTYSEPAVKRWNATIREVDAFLFVTPEYNHRIPGVLKNAIDSVFVSFGFRNKPAAAVGYRVGIAAGARAVEHLAQILIEAEAAPLRNSVLVPKVAGAFDSAGDPIDPMTDAALQIVLDALAWWGTALKAARVQGELLPGSFRMMTPAARGLEQTPGADPHPTRGTAWQPRLPRDGSTRAARSGEPRMDTPSPVLRIPVARLRDGTVPPTPWSAAHQDRRRCATQLASARGQLRNRSSRPADGSAGMTTHPTQGARNGRHGRVDASAP